MKTRVAISIDKKLLKKIDTLLKKGNFRNRNELIKTAVTEKFSKISNSKLAIESTKLKNMD